MTMSGAAAGMPVNVKLASATRPGYFVATTRKSKTLLGNMSPVLKRSKPLVSVKRPGPPPKQPVKSSSVSTVGSGVPAASISPSALSGNSWIWQPKAHVIEGYALIYTQSCFRYAGVALTITGFCQFNLKKKWCLDFFNILTTLRCIQFQLRKIESLLQKKNTSCVASLFLKYPHLSPPPPVPHTYITFFLKRSCPTGVAHNEHMKQS